MAFDLQPTAKLQPYEFLKKIRFFRKKTIFFSKKKNLIVLRNPVF